jgi:dTDP-4-dehydrorhamnose reductase
MGILVFGASGFLGGKIMDYYATKQRKTIGTYANNKKNGLVKYDYEFSDLKRFGYDLRDFSHAVICGSITKMDLCRTDPEKTYSVNVIGTKNLIAQLFDAEIIPIFISTDYVYDGSRGLYSEQDERNPVLAYGKYKKEVEDYLLSSKKNYNIVRTARLYDIAGNDDTILFGLIKELNSGRQLTMATDQIFSPTYIDDVSRAIELLIEKKMTGCYNVCSDEAISRYNMVKMIKDELNIGKGKITPCSLRELKFEDNRPLNTSMSNKRIAELTGIRFMNLKEAIDKVKNRPIHGKKES